MQSSQAESCLIALSHLERRISFERMDESIGYIIRVDGLAYESDRDQVRQIAKTMNLKVHEEVDSISIS